MEDFEQHLEVCETLKQINEDDHDLLSGRFFKEFDYPGLQEDDFVVNMTNWDTFMYSREFNAVNDDRMMRQVTRLLTYPITIASALHELSPYSVKKGERLTPEGLKSFSGRFSRSSGYIVAELSWLFLTNWYNSTSLYAAPPKERRRERCQRTATQSTPG